MYLTHRPRGAAALTLAAVLTAMLAMPASAADTVTQTINAGTRTASIADLPLGAVDYSHGEQTSLGSMTLTVDDVSGSGAGWNVTVQSSDFLYTAGGNNGTAIPAGNFVITSAVDEDIASTAGEAVDTTGGPKVPSSFSAPATLELARKTIQADAGFGEGTYTQALGVSLTIPAQSRVGTYTGTMFVTINSGP